jgi:hypothetical protein
MQRALLAGSVIVAVALCGGAQRSQEQPSITYGFSKVSLGMTVNQVQQSLAGASRHMQTLPDFKESAMVYVDGQSDAEGQIIFGDGRVTYADFKMPAVNTAEELAQEIQGAVDNMETKTCDLSNYTSHGTGGEISQSTFKCGSRRFTVQTFHTFGVNTRTTDVEIAIGHTGK